MDNPQIQMQFGRYGAVTLEGDGADSFAEGNFSSFYCITDTVISGIDAPRLHGASLIGKDLPPGTAIFTPFNNIAISSGLLVAYRSKG